MFLIYNMFITESNGAHAVVVVEVNLFVNNIMFHCANVQVTF